jgi:LysM repeat protein
MPHRSSVRWLAPIVLAGGIAVVVWVTSSSLSDPSSGTPTVDDTPAASATHDRTPPTTKTPSAPTSRTYTVQSGDFLTTVSEKTGVTVDRLRELNPDLDANALRIGQKIRLAAPAAR